MSSDDRIPWNLSPEQEVAAFERLKPRLAALWSEVFPRDDEPLTSVIVPSVSVSAEDLRRRPGALFYEEALLFLLIRLRNPRARVVYVTSQPIAPALKDYYLQFLAGIPASHAAARLTLLSPHDGSLRPLAEKILERPRLVERIRAAIVDPSRAYLTVFRGTPLERRLAVLLGIPLNAADPGAESFCTKSCGRQVMREAGLDIPEGREGLRDEVDVVDALLELGRTRPGLERAVVKLEDSVWDDGDALLWLPERPSRESVSLALRSLEPAAAWNGPQAFLEQVSRRGAVVEECVENAAHLASGQVRISPRGQVSLISTHDEIRSGPHGLGRGGCLFPADERYRRLVHDASLRVGHLLAAKGLITRLSIEYLVDGAEGPQPRLIGTGINLGVGGTTHPLLAVRFLSGGALDLESGLFLSPTGQPRFYRATDSLSSTAYRGFTPADLIEVLTVRGLNYSPQGASGAILYMLGGVSEHGRLGMVAIGGSRDEAEAVYRRTVEGLDQESASAWR